MCAFVCVYVVCVCVFALFGSSLCLIESYSPPGITTPNFAGLRSRVVWLTCFLCMTKLTTTKQCQTKQILKNSEKLNVLYITSEGRGTHLSEMRSPKVDAHRQTRAKIINRRKRSISRRKANVVLGLVSLCGLFLLLLRTSQLVASRYSDNVWPEYDVNRIGKTVTSSTISHGSEAHKNVLQRDKIEKRREVVHGGDFHMDSGMPKPSNSIGDYPRVLKISDSTQYQNLRREPRSIEVSKYALEKQESLRNSDSYDDLRDPLYYKDCVPMQAWQETSFPSCNVFHEADFYGKSRGNEFSHLTSGGYNDVLTAKSLFDKMDVVFKMLEYGTGECLCAVAKGSFLSDSQPLARRF